jgi:hypothetical protein
MPSQYTEKFLPGFYAFGSLFYLTKSLFGASLFGHVETVCSSLANVSKCKSECRFASPPTAPTLGIFWMHYSTLANSIKQSTQLRGGNKGQRGRIQVQAKRANPKVGTLVVYKLVLAQKFRLLCPVNIMNCAVHLFGGRFGPQK